MMGTDSYAVLILACFSYRGLSIFSSPEPKAQGELIVWDLSRRPCVRATDMDLGAFLVVWR